MKRTTIKDVAKRAGVSITTVSHALSGGGVVKQETRDRIRELAREMNYMPSWSGKSLKAVETKVIGLYVEYIRGFYGQLADAMYDICREAGYELNIIIAENGDMILDNLLSNRTDGAIILHKDFGEQHESVLRDSELPAVFLDREVCEQRVSSVLFDSYQTGWMAAEYLYGLGHRSFLFVRGRDTYDGNERCRGFADFLAKQGIDLAVEDQIEGQFDRREARRAMEQFLASGRAMPTGVFAANDDSAIGCMQALKAAGYRVPEDVSVIGCDNIEVGRWYNPGLTTMDIDIAQKGIEAANEILSLIQGENGGRITKTSCKIIERASCAQIK